MKFTQLSNLKGQRLQTIQISLSIKILNIVMLYIMDYIISYYARKFQFDQKN